MGNWAWETGEFRGGGDERVGWINEWDGIGIEGRGKRWWWVWFWNHWRELRISDGVREGKGWERL